MRKKQFSINADGFEGILYYNNIYDKIIITLGGNEGGIKNACRISKFYLKYNIPSLSIAYFNYKKTNKNLCGIKLEYLISAINRVKHLGYKKIGIDAFSKGTELALNVSNIIPLDFLILRAPTYYNSEGLINKCKSTNKCSWCYNNQDLIFTKYPNLKPHFILDYIKEREFNTLKYNNVEINEKSIINTSNIKCPSLLLSSKSDTVWNSYKQSIYLNNNLIHSKHISFDYLSHFLLPSRSVKQMLAYKNERHNLKIVKLERNYLNSTVIDFVNNI